MARGRVVRVRRQRRQDEAGEKLNLKSAAFENSNSNRDWTEAAAN